MRKQMIETAAFDVAAQVRAVEDCIDTALAEIAELQGRVMRARSLAGVGIATGHQALEKLAASVTSLVGARGAMADCHAALVDAKGRVPGLRTVSFGDGEECPDKKTAQLRVVA